MKTFKNISQKATRLFTIAIIISLLFSSCTKEDIAGTSTGSIIFWSNQPGSKITVTVGSAYSGSITKYTSGSVAPACGDVGSYTLSLDNSITYSYKATDGTHNWSGTFSLGSSCKSLLLYW